MTTVLAGTAFGLGLIVAIGAQNAFVLRQGLRREHVGLVVAICALSDLVLIAIGTAGVGRLISAHAGVLRVVTIAGAAVLLWYGWSAARRAVRGEALTPASEAGEAVEAGDALEGIESIEAEAALPGGDREGQARIAVVPRVTRKVALTALALTWLNPHVYLDTVVLLGSVSASYPSPWLFALGAGIGSILWFSALGFGARALAPLFARPVAWRVLDGLIAVVMVAIAIGLLLSLR